MSLITPYTAKMMNIGKSLDLAIMCTVLCSQIIQIFDLCAISTAIESAMCTSDVNARLTRAL